MSDIARVVKPEPAGYAADSRPESPRPYPPGAEKASNANGHLAHNHGDAAR